MSCPPPYPTLPYPTLSLQPGHDPRTSPALVQKPAVGDAATDTEEKAEPAAQARAPSPFVSDTEPSAEPAQPAGNAPGIAGGHAAPEAGDNPTLPYPYPTLEGSCNCWYPTLPLPCPSNAGQRAGGGDDASAAAAAAAQPAAELAPAVEAAGESEHAAPQAGDNPTLPYPYPASGRAGAPAGVGTLPYPYPSRAGQGPGGGDDASAVAAAAAQPPAEAAPAAESEADAPADTDDSQADDASPAVRWPGPFLCDSCHPCPPSYHGGRLAAPSPMLTVWCACALVGTAETRQARNG